MFKKIAEISMNPDDPNLWSAIAIITTIASKISISRIGETSRILIKSIVEQYLEWLKVRSKSEEAS